MGWIVALLWACAIVGAIGIVVLIRVLTAPNDARAIHSNAHHRASDALTPRAQHLDDGWAR